MENLKNILKTQRKIVFNNNNNNNNNNNTNLDLG